MGTLLLISPLYLIYLCFILFITLGTINRGEQKCKTLFGECNLIFAEIIFSVVGPIIGFWRFDQFGNEIPFAKQHVLSIILLVMSSSTSFWLAKFTRNNSNPILRIILSVGMLQGIVLCAITSIHFISFIPLGILYPFAGFELLSPLIAFFLLLREFYFYNKVQLDMEELLPYHKELGFVPLPHKLFQLPMLQRMIFYSILLGIMVAGEIVVAYAFGQDIDSVVKAFTHSVGFIFSIQNH